MPSRPLIHALPTKIAVKITQALQAKRFRVALPQPVERLAAEFADPLSPVDLWLLRAAIAGCQKLINSEKERREAQNKQKNIVRSLRRKCRAEGGGVEGSDPLRESDILIQLFLTKRGIERLQAVFLYSFAFRFYGNCMSKAALKMCAVIMLLSIHPNRTKFDSRQLSSQAEAVRGRFRTLLENHSREECVRVGDALWTHVQRLGALPRASWQGVVEDTEPNMVEDTAPSVEDGRPAPY